MSPASRIRRVFVHDLELMGRVGIYAVEQRYEQRILVSVDLEVIDTYDGASDRLRDVLNYERLIKQIQAVIDSGHVNLLETMAERIAQSCLADQRVLAIRVRVAKPDIIPGCGSVGIEIERRRQA
jgi:dihydroneopterin aldolase